jgi:hypothetical protein
MTPSAISATGLVFDVDGALVLAASLARFERTTTRDDHDFLSGQFPSPLASRLRDLDRPTSKLPTSLPESM